MTNRILLHLYGSHQACNNAYILLENQPQIKRIDIQDDTKTLFIFPNKQLTEKTLIPLLYESGISGFRIE